MSVNKSTMRYFRFLGFLGTPNRSGTISTVDKFDNTFFGIPHSQINSMDPRHRIVLECVYECIVDAGINPKELRGTRTGKLRKHLSFEEICNFYLQL